MMETKVTTSVLFFLLFSSVLLLYITELLAFLDGGVGCGVI